MEYWKIKVSNKIDRMGLVYLENDEYVYLKIGDVYEQGYCVDSAIEILDYCGMLNSVTSNRIHINNTIYAILGYVASAKKAIITEDEFLKAITKSIYKLAKESKDDFTIELNFKRTEERMNFFLLLREIINVK